MPDPKPYGKEKRLNLTQTWTNNDNNDNNNNNNNNNNNDNNKIKTTILDHLFFSLCLCKICSIGFVGISFSFFYLKNTSIIAN